MIFAKNIIPGHVKTRLAERVGEEKAVAIYRMLLEYTHQIARGVEVDRQIWYDRFVPEDPLFSEDDFDPRVQQGRDLGERMKYAFKEAFDEGYQNVIIIGTDCAELNSKIIRNAFDLLKTVQVVLGPAEDGGYYLAGMKDFYPYLFENKSWGTNKVYEQTTFALEQAGIDWTSLDTLQDVDRRSDWVQIRKKLKNDLKDTGPYD